MRTRMATECVKSIAYELTFHALTLLCVWTAVMSYWPLTIITAMGLAGVTYKIAKMP